MDLLQASPVMNHEYASSRMSRRKVFINTSVPNVYVNIELWLALVEFVSKWSPSCIIIIIIIV